MVYLTRIEKFNAAHRLYVEEWSEDKNDKVFGRCANRNWHGHNYKLHVTVKGMPDEKTGFIIDAKELSCIIQHCIIDKVDHRNLNLDVPFIQKNTQPTTENLVMLFWKELVDHLPEGSLHKLKLEETDSIYAEFYGL